MGGLVGLAGDFVKLARQPPRLLTLCALGILFKRGGADAEVEKNARAVAAGIAQRLRGRSQYSYSGRVHRQVVRVDSQHVARIWHHDAQPRRAQPPHPVPVSLVAARVTPLREAPSGSVEPRRTGDLGMRDAGEEGRARDLRRRLHRAARRRPGSARLGRRLERQRAGAANLSRQQILDFFNAVYEPDPGRSLFAGAKLLVDEMRDLISNAARRALRAGGKRTLSYRCRTEPSTKSRTAVSN
jgi:hypothetical protein